jgi:hypothetical protein
MWDIQGWAKSRLGLVRPQNTGTTNKSQLWFCNKISEHLGQHDPAWSYWFCSEIGVLHTHTHTHTHTLTEDGFPISQSDFSFM